MRKLLKHVLVCLIKNEQSPKFIFYIHTDLKILCLLCVMRNIEKIYAQKEMNYDQ